MKVREVVGFAADAARPIRPAHIRAVRQTAMIRRMSGLEIAGNHELVAETRAQFAAARRGLQSGEAVPAIIPVQNEAEDLPGTLLSIARAGNVLPVVVNNRSTDQTAELAAHMGADILDQPSGKKMAATQKGVVYVRQELHASTMLATDGDTLVLPTWGTAMQAPLQKVEQGAGAVAYGSALMLFGKSRLADAAATGLGLMYGHLHQRRHELPLALGANYAVQFDDDGVIEQTLGGMDPNLFMGRDPSDHEDLQVRDALAVADVALMASLDPAAWVMARHDRVDSVRSVLAAATGRVSSVDTVLASYAAEYGPLPGMSPRQA